METSYKEKYERALAKAKEQYNYPCMRSCMGILEEIFPELADSEDEKVREELIKHLKEGAEGYEPAGGSSDYQRWLAWVKKQGKTSPVLSNFSNIGKDEQKPLGYVHHIDEDGYYTKEAILEPNPYTGTGFDYNGHHWGMCARDGGVEILMDGNITSRVFPDKNNIIEQKPTDSYCQENCKGFQETGKCFADGDCKAKREAEQKPVIEFKTAEESLCISSDEYNKIVDECLFGEQKLTEFERGLFDMLTDISKPRTADCVKSHSEKLLSIARKMIALEQKPEENNGNIGGISPNWSEEDEEMLDSIIGDIYNADTLIGGKETASNKCSWLKSLKGRVKPYWKPSETDIMILEKVIKGELEPKVFQATLQGILEQLKKLKEE